MLISSSSIVITSGIQDISLPTEPDFSIGKRKRQVVWFCCFVSSITMRLSLQLLVIGGNEETDYLLFCLLQKICAFLLASKAFIYVCFIFCLYDFTEHRKYDFVYMRVQKDNIVSWIILASQTHGFKTVIIQYFLDLYRNWFRFLLSQHCLGGTRLMFYGPILNFL